MSYDLRVWTRPAGQSDPATFDDACRTMLQLEQLQPGVNPNFVALALRMVERYPVRGHQSAVARDNGDAAWISDPLADAMVCTRAVWAIELPLEQRVRVLRDVVQAANVQGLTVLDDQLGMAFLPSGQVLPPENTALWEGAKREMDVPSTRWDLGMVRKALKPRLAALLEPYGFVPSKLELKSQLDAKFGRLTECGNQHINISSRNLNATAECWISVEIIDSLVKNALTEIFPERANSPFTAGEIYFNVGTFEGNFNGAFSIASDADVLRLIAAFKRKAIPVLESTKTSFGFYRAMTDAELYPIKTNHPLEAKSLAEYCRSTGFAPLVSAWMNRSPAVEEIERAINNRSAKYAAQLKERENQNVARVLAYLRQKFSYE